MMSLEEATALFGLHFGASLKELEDRRRLLVMVWHPDRFPQESAVRDRANEELKSINEAYEVVHECIAGTGWPAHEPNSSNGVANALRCSCGSSAVIDYQLMSVGDVFIESDHVTVTEKRLRSSVAFEDSLLLLTYLDQEAIADPRTYASCTRCTPCAICGEAVQDVRFLERQRRIVSNRAGSEYWQGTEFTYIHPACQSEYVELVNRVRKEMEKAEEQAILLARQAREQRESRLRERRCLICGERLTFWDAISGKQAHVRCR